MAHKRADGSFVPAVTRVPHSLKYFHWSVRWPLLTWAASFHWSFRWPFFTGHAGGHFIDQTGGYFSLVTQVATFY